MRAQPRQPGDPDHLEYAVGPWGLYSDSTHLSSFGHASLWPAYAYFLAQSKYIRGKPTSFSAHHIAYLPSLPDVIQDAYIQEYGIPASAAVLTFLKRELMQAVWLLLLDDRFMYAYVHGIVFLCGDEVMRRMFIRFLIYAADYPEKMLLACLRYFARCPCPRCRINKDKIIEMGTQNDLFRRNWVRVDDSDAITRAQMARRWVFEDGLPLTSVHIERLLDPLSLTPTRSAFSIRLREHGFNHYSLFVPDLMHEFELGVWKSIWVHLLRLLYAVGEDTIQELNMRFRQVPTFGRATIRRFSGNVSGQGKLAARDYEARLQCFCPTYEGLLRGPASTRDNGIVLDLGFDLAMWHCLAKLREHTTLTLDGLDVKTVDVGRSVRIFAKKTCTEYITFELPSKDEAARGRRKTAFNKGQGVASKVAAAALSKKRKYFSYTTYKFHAMRDYSPAIRAVASSDNFNTQVGELEHRHVKRFYARTNHNKAAFQIAQHMRRADKLRIIKMRVDSARHVNQQTQTPPIAALATGSVGCTEYDSGGGPSPNPEAARLNGSLRLEPLPYTADPLARYHVSESQREHDDLSRWLASFGETPVAQYFLAELKDHVLDRLNDLMPAGEDLYTLEDRPRVVFMHNRIYWHRVLRINFTTYDRRRTQESINPRTHPDVLLLAANDSEGDHPFWYARILKIFHVNVRVIGAANTDLQRINILWARWFRMDAAAPGGIAAKRLPRLEFVPPALDGDIPNAEFTFLNPADVVRGAHIIPAFAHGRLTSTAPARTIIHDNVRVPANQTKLPCARDAGPELDFRYYYVNIFADRDMFMRYYGGGIGHHKSATPPDIAFDNAPFRSAWEDIDEPEGLSSVDASSDEGDDPSAEGLPVDNHPLTGDEGPGFQEHGDEDDGLGHVDSDDEELDAHAQEDANVSEPDDEEAGSASGDDLETGLEGDEYAEEGFAPL
ncbi:hypothetical protein C2E23DRAFT_763412 [Lenzites betulinus]|nr:hypothetical protein C2E23DRAFT_763412 [Lenzites betulinus]